MDIKLLTEVEKQSIGERQPLPDRYLRLSDDEMDERIAAAKRTLGERVVILGHHYQRDEVIKFADYTGDSLKLARAAASRGKAEYIIFCGVHFMAEAADILRAPHQQVILPNMAAGCSMADMAAPDDVFSAWDELVFFFPDQHLGRNTGVKMGIGLDEMTVWNYRRPYGSLGGNALEQLE